MRLSHAPPPPSPPQKGKGSAPSLRHIFALAGKHGLISLVCFVCVSAVTVSVAQALDLPALSGRVVDQAGVLDQATRAALSQKLADLEAKTTDQVVVVTLR